MDNDYSVIYIRLTKNCNAKCYMCDFWKNKNIEVESDKVWKFLSDNQNIKLVRFTGGEPLLCDDLPQYIRKLCGIGIKTSIITNGMLLEKKIEKLAGAGLSQIVLSVDGPNNEIHDSIRGTKGLFNKIERALLILNNEYPDINIRVNTVVSEKNIKFLPQMPKWLESYKVDQWSIIPLKLNEYKWSDCISLEEFIEYYYSFQRAAKKCKVKLLGYSLDWAGNPKDFWRGEYINRAKGECNLVKLMKFYDPFTDHIYPCNCIPHRPVKFDSYEQEVLWYLQNANNYCTGCEPLNAYYADHPDELVDNILNI